MYVLVVYGENLGPTIRCQSYNQAIQEAKRIAKDDFSYNMTAEDVAGFYDSGVLLPDGCKIEIGSLEEPESPE